MHRHRALVRLHQPAHDGEPEPPPDPGVRAASPRNATSNTRGRSASGIPPQPSVTANQPPSPSRPPLTVTVPSEGVYRIALRSRLARIRDSSGSLARTTGQPDSSATSRTPRAAATGAAEATASETTSPSATRARDSRSAPAVMRDSSNRSSTSPAIRSVSTRMRRWYSATVSGSTTTPSSSASAMARIPASGVRRSCETHATRSRRCASAARS